MSAIRAGLSPLAADLFADVDLQRICPAQRVDHYPEALPQVLASSAADYWIYTGAIENHPKLVAQMEKLRPLLGNGPAVICAVCDPLQLHSALRSAGIDSPDVTLDPSRLPRDGSWLRKPRRSAGGTGIEPLVSNTLDKPSRGVYFQQRITGQPCSAIFVSADSAAVLLGVTEQIIGAAWTGADGFRYCGSIGPLLLSSPASALWNQIGNCLAERFGLVGLWGVDAIISGDAVYPIEVNPRYTASVEVLERALGIKALRYHLQTFLTGELPRPIIPQPSACIGKAIVYAPALFRITSELADWLDKIDSSLQQTQQFWPNLADIPARGTIISAGWPIATVFAESANRQQCKSVLQRRAAELLDIANHSL
jgi:predicted ATP-grasp superfamily ATP-dependent carboligase